MQNYRKNAVPHLAPLAIIAATLACWIFLITGAGMDMSVLMMSTFEFPPPVDGSMPVVPWTPGHVVTVLAMWWLMMIAMMLPGVAGNLWSYAGLNRAGEFSALWFGLGYTLPWLLFSIAAATVQYGLERNGLLHAKMMWSTDSQFSASVLAVAGLYQVSNFKSRILMRCRSDRNISEPLRHGLSDAAFCFANTTPLMLLLFVGGIMNMVWIVALTLINLLEKYLPDPRLFSSGVGVACLGAAVYLLVRGG